MTARTIAKATAASEPASRRVYRELDALQRDACRSASPRRSCVLAACGGVSSARCSARRSSSTRSARRSLDAMAGRTSQREDEQAVTLRETGTVDRGRAHYGGERFAEAARSLLFDEPGNIIACPCARRCVPGASSTRRGRRAGCSSSRARRGCSRSSHGVAAARSSGWDHAAVPAHACSARRAVVLLAVALSASEHAMWAFGGHRPAHLHLRAADRGCALRPATGRTRSSPSRTRW